jgi:superfamily I DNA and/or RNA helicase
VRSNPQGQIGFVSDRRRTNVALSRAKDRLIIVGNWKCVTRRQRRVWCDLWRIADHVA